MPLSITIGPGNEHDSKKLLELVEGLDGKPGQLYADSAYNTEPIRRGLESIGIEPNIPVNPRNGRRPRPYNVGLYSRMRSAVERFFGWLKSFRRIIIRRYDEARINIQSPSNNSINNHTPKIRNLEMSSEEGNEGKERGGRGRAFSSLTLEKPRRPEGVCLRPYHPYETLSRGWLGDISRPLQPSGSFLRQAGTGPAFWAFNVIQMVFRTSLSSFPLA